MALSNVPVKMLAEVVREMKFPRKINFDLPSGWAQVEAEGLIRAIINEIDFDEEFTKILTKKLKEEADFENLEVFKDVNSYYDTSINLMTREDYDDHSKNIVDLYLDHVDDDPIMDILVTCNYFKDTEEPFEDISFDLVPRYLFNSIVTKSTNKEETGLAFNQEINYALTMDIIDTHHIRRTKKRDKDEQSNLEAFNDLYHRLIRDGSATVEGTVDYAVFEEAGIDYENKDNWRKLFNLHDYNHIIAGNFQIKFVNAQIK